MAEIIRIAESASEQPELRRFRKTSKRKPRFWAR